MVQFPRIKTDIGTGEAQLFNFNKVDDAVDYTVRKRDEEDERKRKELKEEAEKLEALENLKQGVMIPAHLAMYQEMGQEIRDKVNTPGLSEEEIKEIEDKHFAVNQMHLDYTNTYGKYAKAAALIQAKGVDEFENAKEVLSMIDGSYEFDEETSKDSQIQAVIGGFMPKVKPVNWKNIIGAGYFTKNITSANSSYDDDGVLITNSGNRTSTKDIENRKKQFKIFLTDEEKAVAEMSKHAESEILKELDQDDYDALSDVKKEELLEDKIWDMFNAEVERRQAISTSYGEGKKEDNYGGFSKSKVAPLADNLNNIQKKVGGASGSLINKPHPEGGKVVKTEYKLINGKTHLVLYNKENKPINIDLSEENNGGLLELYQIAVNGTDYKDLAFADYQKFQFEETGVANTLKGELKQGAEKPVIDETLNTWLGGSTINVTDAGFLEDLEGNFDGYKTIKPVGYKNGKIAFEINGKRVEIERDADKTEGTPNGIVYKKIKDAMLKEKPEKFMTIVERKDNGAYDGEIE